MVGLNCPLDGIQHEHGHRPLDMPAQEFSSSLVHVAGTIPEAGAKGERQPSTTITAPASCVYLQCDSCRAFPTETAYTLKP